MEKIFWNEKEIKTIENIEEFLTLEIVYKPTDDDTMNEIRNLPYHGREIKYKNKNFYISDFRMSMDHDEFFIVLKEVR